MHACDRVLRRGGRLLPAEALRFATTPSGLHHALPGLGLPEVDPENWRLVVGGHTRYALGLSLTGLRRRATRTVDVVLETPGIGGAASQATWTGTPLTDVLAEAGPLPGAGHVLFQGADRAYAGSGAVRGQAWLPLDGARTGGVLLAWAMNGEPLALEHGYPVRLIVPGREERASVRWLGSISVLDGPAPDGTEPAWLAPRALIEPPGLLDQDQQEPEPDRWVVRPGAVSLRGRAWNGRDPLQRVEVSFDGGATWSAARLTPPVDPAGWGAWEADWQAEAGPHRLGARAAGAGEPGEASFLDVDVRA